MAFASGNERHWHGVMPEIKCKYLRQTTERVLRRERDRLYRKWMFEVVAPDPEYVLGVPDIAADQALIDEVVRHVRFAWKCINSASYKKSKFWHILREEIPVGHTRKRRYPRMRLKRRRVLASMLRGESQRWRPHLHCYLPGSIRATMRTLVILAKTRIVLRTKLDYWKYGTMSTDFKHLKNARGLYLNGNAPACYPRACLELLPEELLQYIYEFIVNTPIELNADEWSMCYT